MVIKWAMVQGDIAKIALGHRTGGTNRRKKRETVNGFAIILDNVKPDNTDIINNGTFDLSVDNEFMLFAYDSSLDKPIGKSQTVHFKFETEGKIKQLSVRIFTNT